jgi:hypothetical protein
VSHFDAILIPGGGVRAGGQLPLWVERRLDRAIARRGDAWLIALSAGTTHRPPPLDSRGFPIIEAAAEADYLLRNGVPPNRILMEAASYDTIGNAYFSLVIHVQPRRFERLLVVTSEFHVRRTEALFRWIYGLARPFDLHFEATPNDGIEARSLASRREKEDAALHTLPDLINRIHSLADLHQWMFREHGAYAAGKIADRSSDPELLDTY